ncbi:MAG TPA: hypothetical protein VFO59_07635, partial [Dehalococcoidia bacterium]|nr:hypothetical protein [Dehalococcoidia bacterium]
MSTRFASLANRAVHASVILAVAFLALLFIAIPGPRESVAALFTATDENGPNDVPGQKDLTRLSVDTISGGLAVTWNWDVVSLSGNNTADACSLFDSDGDGFANFSLCEVWDNGQTEVDTRLYTCGDARADRCTNPALVSTFTSSCNVANTTDDPFSVGDSYPRDTKATCTINLSDVGAASAQLLNVCSYPSQEPNSDPSDCVLVPRDGFLVIVKVASPDDTTQFPFVLDSETTPLFTATGSETSSAIPVRSDINHSLREVLPAGWRLDSASCTLAGGGSTGTKSGETISNIDVAQGATTTCTFNDTKLNPALTINKTISSGAPYDSVGDVISYSYLVTNSGNVSLPGPVSISDDKATNESCPLVSTVGN